MATEKRLIDANALKKRMFSYYECVNEHTSKSTYTGETLMNYEVGGLIEDCIDDAPTVDAVEVVRCKDCLYRNERDDCTHKWWTDSEGWYKYVGDDDFCSYGERKDNG